MGLLKKAALHFQSLFDMQYHITYGQQKQLHHVKISFSMEEFFRLAGFHYLKDIKIPRIKGKDLFSWILNGKITESDIALSKNYESNVKGRLEVLCHLQQLLEEDNTLFHFNPQKYVDIAKSKQII